MTEPILQVKDLKTYYYSQKTTVAAVDGVDFSLEKGSVLGIVGESGWIVSSSPGYLKPKIDLPNPYPPVGALITH